MNKIKSSLISSKCYSPLLYLLYAFAHVGQRVPKTELSEIMIFYRYLSSYLFEPCDFCDTDPTVLHIYKNTEQELFVEKM